MCEWMSGCVCECVPVGACSDLHLLDQLLQHCHGARHAERRVGTMSDFSVSQLDAFLVKYQSAPCMRDKYSRKFIRFTNLQSCTIIKYSSSTTHVRFELDLTSTLPVLIRVSSTDHVGIKYRSSLDRD